MATYRLPGRPPRGETSPRPADAQGGPVLDPGGDADLQAILHQHHARPLAGAAGMADHPPLAAAALAGGGDHQKALLVDHLTPAAALRAGLGRGALLGARAAALGAHRPAPVHHLLGGAGGRLGQRQLDLGLDVRARARPAAAPEQIAEDVGERREHVADVAEAAEAAALQALVTVTVIQRALLGIGQHLVGLGRLLELGLGGVVARVAVGVILHRELPVGPLELPGLDVPGHAQDDVIVALLAHGGLERRKRPLHVSTNAVSRSFESRSCVRPGGRWSPARSRGV